MGLFPIRNDAYKGTALKRELLNDTETPDFGKNTSS